MGRFYVELAGDASDYDSLKSAVANLVALRSTQVRGGRLESLPRMRCGVGAGDG
jgi:hypothetical protein